MATNAELAAKLLTSAANFFRALGQQNDEVRDSMEKNAETYDLVAQWILEDPTGDSPVEGDVGEV